MTRGMTVLYLLLTLVGGVVVLWKMADIQFGTHTFIKDKGDTLTYTWREKGKQREFDLDTDTARRGNIYSNDGKILATTVKECDFCLDLNKDFEYDAQGNPVYDKNHNPKQNCPIVDSNYSKYLDTVCLLLHRSFPKKSVEYYRNRIDNERKKVRPSRCFVVEKRVPYSTWQTIAHLSGWKNGVVREKVEKEIINGREVMKTRSVIKQRRAHIYGNMAENTIGFYNSESLDTYTGLEGAYDSILRGQNGKFYRRRLTKGLWLPDEPHGRKEIVQHSAGEKVDTVVVQNKVDGMSIVSTIDTRYQDIAESSLRKALSQYGGSGGCAILMEMETGYVLACANLAVDTASHSYLEVRDRNVAVSDVYEPGSTFKTVILTAMLNDPDVKIDTAMQLKCGYKNFGGKYGEIKDDHTLEDRDSLNVREVIEQSSNVGMSDLGWRLYNTRRDTLRHLVERIFPYEKLHPDVRAREYNSRINDLHTSNRDFLNFCYGYSTRVSALQLITFYNALGAEGRMVKPQFCKGVMYGDRMIASKPIVLNPKICSRESARMMRTMLEGVVEHGTGNNIKNNTYGIAGKTGTAVHSYANVRRYNASFAGFFPSENPRYTCLVVLQDIPFYGRQAALVFKAISDCVVAVDKRLSGGAVKSAWPRLEADSAKALQNPKLEKGRQKEIEKIYKTLGRTYRTSDKKSEWVYYSSGNDSTAAGYRPYHPKEGLVPQCLGMSAKDAVALLRQQGYRATVRGYGKVALQQPKGGTAAAKGIKVVLELR